MRIAVWKVLLFVYSADAVSESEFCAYVVVGRQRRSVMSRTWRMIEGRFGFLSISIRTVEILFRAVVEI